MSPMSKPNQTSFKKGNIPWNKGKSLPIWFKKRLSQARLNSKYRTGKLHPRWKGGQRGYYGDIARKLLLKNNIPLICSICNTKIKRIHIHHKDRNWKNNLLENLIILCISCHLKIHHQEDKTKKNICQWCGKIFYSRIKKQITCSSNCNLAKWKSTHLKRYKTIQHKWYIKSKKRKIILLNIND